MVVPGSTVLITRRTLRRHHLFVPGPLIQALFLYVLGFYAARFGMLVHAFELMSTHYHIVLTDPQGRLPDFLRDFNRIMALGVKVLLGWEGSVWDSRKTSVVRLVTPQAIIEKIAYTMANAVAAGLVERSEEWPGAKTTLEELGTATLEADRPRVFFDQENAQWTANATIQLTVPPSLGMTVAEYQEIVAQELRILEEEAHLKMEEAGRTFLGARRCKLVNPYQRRSRSFETSRALNPTFAVGRGNHEMRRGAMEQLRAFLEAYRDAFRRWREGARHVVFPAGTWAMASVHGAATEPIAA